MSGKGSNLRPAQITPYEWAKRYARTFGLRREDFPDHALARVDQLHHAVVVPHEAVVMPRDGDDTVAGPEDAAERPVERAAYALHTQTRDHTK